MTASPRHDLLIRRHLKTGELAFHYCFVPEGQPVTPETARLLAAALAWPTPPGHATHWQAWRRRHQALARWYHQRTRLATENAVITQLS